MNKYTVTVKPVETTAAGAFQMIRCIVVEFSHYDHNGNEVYVINVERDIDNELNRVDAVISYSQE